MKGNKIYKEPDISKALVYLNRRYIELYYSVSGRDFNRYALFREIVKRHDFRRLLKQLKIKIKHNKYYSYIGNKKYNRFIDEGICNISQGAKLAVYSCIIGTYDAIPEPMYINPDIDYFLFTDQEVENDSRWMKMDVSEWEEYGELSPVQLNRKIKILSHRYLKEYDYSLYIDGNIQIAGDIYPILCNMGDTALGVHIHAGRDCAYMEGSAVELLKKSDPVTINQQLDRYRAEGFPEHFGLFQNSILVRNHRCDKCIALMELWWDEYTKNNTRDQLSLPYVMWKNNIKSSDIKVLGKDASQNPRFIIGTHL